MSNLPTVRVGGVPEHFNYPWHLAQERGLFAKHGVNVQWVEQKEGTGQMIKSVRISAILAHLVGDTNAGAGGWDSIQMCTRQSFLTTFCPP